MMPSFDPDEGLAEQLVEFDERLRSKAATVRDRPRAPAGNEAEKVDALIDCVRMLEERWPRGSSGATGVKVAPDLGPMAPQVGRFAIERELGRGGFGAVFLATDERDGRQVALKIFRPETALDGESRSAFLREVKAAAGFDHPHIAAVYEAGEVGNLCYAASAYCPGPTLHEWLARRRKPMAPRQAARLVERLSLAVNYAHERGVWHGDLKPANVLLWLSDMPVTDDDGPFVPKLADFGMAKVVEKSLAALGQSVLLGTPLYLAPEQVAGRWKEVGPSADIHALGSILYELLAAAPPFEGKTLADVFDRIRRAEPVALRHRNAEIPRELATICERCLQKRPGDRYRSARELAEDLRRWLEGRPIAARRVSSWRRALAWLR